MSKTNREKLLCNADFSGLNKVGKKRFLKGEYHNSAPGIAQIKRYNLVTSDFKLGIYYPLAVIF